MLSAAGAALLVGSGTHPSLAAPASMPLISRGVPAFASSQIYPASSANDADYTTVWRGNIPSWIAYDLSGVPAAKRGQVIVAWYNDPQTSPYDRTVVGEVAYNSLRDYTVEANAAPGGTAAPTTGWVTLATVTGNHYHSRQHLVDLTGYNWVRLNITAGDGSSGNTAASFNLDVHDASQGPKDSWIFLGDSITMDGTHHEPVNGVGNFSQLINAGRPASYPAYEDGGIGGLLSTDGAQHIAAWLSTFPGTYVGLSYGTNDANGCASTTTFYNNYVSMVQTVLSLGKVPVVPTIPWAKSANVQSCGPGFNAQIQALYAAYPQVVKGPDLWSYFKANQSLISSDGLHPSAAGYAGFRQQWASAMLANVYASGPSVTLTPTSLSFGSQRVGTGAAQTSTLRNSGTAPLTIGGIAVSGPAAGDYVQTSDCPLAPAALAAGAACTISATFTPSTAGSRAAAVTITDDAAGSPHSLALTGTGTAPAVTLTPTSLAFPGQPIGSTSEEEDVTLTDVGNAALAIGSIAVGGADAADFSEADQCPATLAAGASCTIAVRFTPDGAGGRSASLTVSDDAPASPQVVSLAGTGVAPAPAVTLAPAALAFGSQLVGSTSAARTSALTNSGNTPLTISSIAVAGSGDFAESDDCPPAPATLAPGAMCTLSVTFTPSGLGTRTATVSIADDAPDTPQALALSGTGTGPAPAVSLAPASVAFGGQRVGTASANQPVTLTNSGTADLTISGIAVTGTNASDYAQTNPCPASLAAGASCTVNVTFTPSATGSRTASLTVTDDAAGSPQTVALSGTGTQPAVTLTPTSLTFGSQAVGTTSPAQTVTLRNSGTAPLAISSILLGGTNAADFAQTNTCPLVPSLLAVNATCTISATFTPSATGTRTASITVTDDAPNGAQTIAVSGTGAGGAPAVTLSPTTLAFGTQGVNTSSAPQSTTLRNSGTGPLTISAIALVGTNATSYSQTNTCPIGPATLPAGATCTATVTFKPTGTGTRNATLRFTDNAGGSPHNVSLTGTGATSTLTLSPTSLTFAAQAVGTTSASKTSTLRNTGTIALTIGSIAVTGTNAGDYARTTTCPISPATLAASATCTITVTFSPTAAGTRTGAVTITDSATGSPHTLPLTGTGTSTVGITLSPTSLAFGSQRVGTTAAAQTISVRSSGTAPLSIAGIAITGANAADFAQTNDCPVSPATLAVNATCTVSVTFAPGATGSRTASVSITDNATGSPHTAALTGTGTAPAVTITPASLTFAGQSIGTTGASQSAVLRNSGTAPLTITSIGLTGTNAADFAQTNDCPAPPAQLAVNATCTLSVAFSPTTPGARSATVSIVDDAAGSPQAVALSGTGTQPGPAATLTSSLSFGSQRVGTTSSAQQATLTNSGTAPLTISSIGLTGTSAADYAQTSTCPTTPSTLAPGAACTITVTFTPSAPGSRSASVAVTDDASGSPHTAGLSGTGTEPAVMLTPASLGFGGQTVGTSSAAQSVTVRNSGTAPLSIGSILIGGTNAGDFAQTNNCPTVPSLLAANATCTISVTFAPSAIGARSATVTIGDDAPGSPHGVPLAGTGSAAGAIALDRNLGAKTDNVASTSLTLTTTAAAAAGSRVFAFVDWTNSTRTLSSVTGGGLTWTVDVQAKATNSSIRQAIASAPAPAGLAANTVLQATFSGSVGHGLISAASFTGIATTTPLDTTASGTQAGVTNWSCTLTTTNANDLVLGWSTIDANATSTATAPNTEIHDFGDANYYGWATSVFRIEASTGAKTVSGTWSTNNLASSNLSVCAAYKAG